MGLAALCALSPTRSAAQSPSQVDIVLPRFRIVFTPRAAGAARLLEKTIELERDALATRLGQDYEGMTEVRLFDGAEEAARVAPPGAGPPHWAAGVAYPAQNILLLDARVLRRDDARQVLVHELAHLALWRTGSGRWPRWFQEGFAMMVAGEWSLSRYTAMYRATVGEAAIPLSALEAHFPERHAEVEIAYAESLSFVSHLVERHGEARFKSLIAGVAGGEPFVTSFQSVYRVDLSEEEEAWRKSLSSRYTWVPVLTATGTVWILITALFLLAYARTRRRSHERLLVMEIEEHARESALRIAAAESAARRDIASAGDASDDDPSSEEPPATNEGPLLH
jgi:hypothetical protein